MKRLVCLSLTVLSVIILTFYTYGEARNNENTSPAELSDSSMAAEQITTSASSEASVNNTYAEDGLKKINKQLSVMNGLEDIECYRIYVDTCECEEHNSIITFCGTYGNGTEKWSKTYTISYEAFLSLYDKSTPFVVYNTEIIEDDDYFDIIVEADEKKLKIVYEILRSFA